MRGTVCPTPAPPSPPTIVSILRWAPLPSEPVTRSRSDQSNTQLGRTPGLRQPRTRGPCHHVNVTCLSHVQFRVDTCRHCASCRDRCESRQCYCQRYRDRIQCVKKPACPLDCINYSLLLANLHHHCLKHGSGHDPSDHV